MQSATVLVEAIILEGKDRDRIGSTTDLDPVICCTRELVHSGSCNLSWFINKSKQY